MNDQTEIRCFLFAADAPAHAGMLFQLADQDPLQLPDRGDGEPVSIDRDVVSECPPFAENIPPGQCGVEITSFRGNVSEDDAGSVRIEHDIHRQPVIVPIRPGDIGSVEVLDRVRGFVADSYIAPSDPAGEVYALHVTHLGPGFYEAAFDLNGGDQIRLTFIKHFPQYFVERSTSALIAEHVAADRSLASNAAAAAPAMPSGPDDLLNTALKLTTEWGENFGKPINNRILAIFPDLTGSDIADLTKQSRAAESFIYSLAERELNGELTESDIVPLAIERFPWLSRENAQRLCGIGMFYARK